MKYKTAIVTGGARGIGKAITARLLDEGISVVILDVKEKEGKLTVDELRRGKASSAKDTTGDDTAERKVCFEECNISDSDKVQEGFKKAAEFFGKKVDLVVHCAAVILEQHPDWKKTIDTNMVGTVNIIRTGMEFMDKRKSGQSGGLVVNISSTGSLGALTPVPVYSATKSAINQLTICYGSDLYYKATGVKVIAILPGLTDTPMIRESPKNVVQEPQIVDEWEVLNRDSVPQPPENIANLLAELLPKVIPNGSLWCVSENKDPVRIKLTYTGLNSFVSLLPDEEVD